jgi:hypothetical protein
MTVANNAAAINVTAHAPTALKEFNLAAAV